MEVEVWSEEIPVKLIDRRGVFLRDMRLTEIFPNHRAILTFDQGIVVCPGRKITSHLVFQATCRFTPRSIADLGEETGD